MRLRPFLLAMLPVALLGPAALVAAPNPERKAAVDRTLSRVEARARAARGREQVLTTELAAYSRKVRLIEARLAPLAARRDHLVLVEGRLRQRLGRLNTDLTAERARLARAEDGLRSGRLRMIDEVRALYRSRPRSGIALVITGEPIARVVAENAAARRVLEHDGNLVRKLAALADEVRGRRDRVERLRDEVRRDALGATRAADEARRSTAELERGRNELNRVRSRTQALLAGVVESREDLEAEARDLRAQSLRLTNEIIQAQGGTVATIGPPSAAGFIWPVAGVLTSRFGWRWGRMHEGIDVGAGTGTPIAAAASGRVIVAGWNGGYGQLVVVDHGNGLSTAYAHQSRMAVAVGQLVAQGTILGYVGSTGNSTGPHLHFEVRVNGAARDPLPYL